MKWCVCRMTGWICWVRKFSAAIGCSYLSAAIHNSSYLFVHLHLFVHLNAAFKFTHFFRRSCIEIVKHYCFHLPTCKLSLECSHRLFKLLFGFLCHDFVFKGNLQEFNVISLMSLLLDSVEHFWSDVIYTRWWILINVYGVFRLLSNLSHVLVSWSEFRLGSRISFHF